MSEWLEEGKPIPPFQLIDADGHTIKSAQWAGAPVVIYFYPKDDTPGCTRQACGFRDVNAELKQLGATVVGVSGDSSASHAKVKVSTRPGPQSFCRWMKSSCWAIRFRPCWTRGKTR